MATKPLIRGELPPPFHPDGDQLAFLHRYRLRDVIAWDDETNTAPGYNGLIGSRTTLVSRGVSTRMGTWAFVVVGDGRPMDSVADAQLSAATVQIVRCRDEVDLLRRSSELMGNLHRILGPQLVVTWNGAFFDVSVTVDRARTNGLDLADDLQMHVTANDGSDTFHPVVNKYPVMEGHTHPYELVWAGHPHVDLMQVFQDVTGRQASLKPTSTAQLDLTPIQVDYERMHELSLRQLAEYTASDVMITRQLAFEFLEPMATRAMPPDQARAA